MSNQSNEVRVPVEVAGWLAKHFGYVPRLSVQCVRAGGCKTPQQCNAFGDCNLAGFVGVYRSALRVSLALLALAVAGCTDADKATRVLQAQGFKDIKITGYRVWGCDDGKDSSDVYHTGFEATGPAGSKVSGIVCSGFLKEATVRYD